MARLKSGKGLFGSISKPKHRQLPNAGHDLSEARKELRPVFFADGEGFRETAVYNRYRLSHGHRFEGPALVEEMDSTSLILPGFQTEVDCFGNLLITPVT